MCDYSSVRNRLLALGAVLALAMSSVIFAMSVAHIPLWGQVASRIAYAVAATASATAAGLAFAVDNALAAYCACVSDDRVCAGACGTMRQALAGILGGVGVLAVVSVIATFATVTGSTFWLVALLVGLTVAVIAAIAASASLESCQVR